MDPFTHLIWDIKLISESLKISDEEVEQYFTDGRRISFLVERRIRDIISGNLATSEGAGFDLYDSNKLKWEVRSLTATGIYFCPSYMVGSGRIFEEPGFLNKLSECKGYYVSDITLFPKIPCYKISSDKIKDWWISGQLGTTTKVSRKKFLNLIR